MTQGQLKTFFYSTKGIRWIPCKPLYDYVSYVGRKAENKKQGLSTQEAVDDAVNWAFREDGIAEGKHKKQALA